MFVCVFSTCLLSLPGRNEVACSGGAATEDVGVASCEAVSESLSPMSMSLGTVSNNNNNMHTQCIILSCLCVIVYKQVYKQKK